MYNFSHAYLAGAIHSPSWCHIHSTFMPRTSQTYLWSYTLYKFAEKQSVSMREHTCLIVPCLVWVAISTLFCMILFQCGIKKVSHITLLVIYFRTCPSQTLRWRQAPTAWCAASPPVIPGGGVHIWMSGWGADASGFFTTLCAPLGILQLDVAHRCLLIAPRSNQIILWRWLHRLLFSLQEMLQAPLLSSVLPRHCICVHFRLVLSTEGLHFWWPLFILCTDVSVHNFDSTRAVF
jgi:hypothetical protein